VRINNPSALPREVLIKYLVEGICQTSFVKVKDGSTRVLYCTLHFSMIPTKFSKSLEKILNQNPPDPDILPVWDVAEGKWKSFRISKMVLMLTSDELKKENIKGFSVLSSSVERIKEAQKKSIERFEIKKEELKNKNIIINGDNEDENQA
jgi:hypothetical protein